ncbi:MAG TPA: SHOCT domain-containing protein, partial [Ktedonobacteraceae bacterium]|nr:SHOCT domain-containing protein [Ktedonobacteraceae bacterium]
GDLAAGGIGYMLGSRSAQQQAPQYQAPQYQPPVPQYQPNAAYQPAPAAQANNERLAQLKLLGHLRDSNLLTNDEFEEEKQKILHG